MKILLPDPIQQRIIGALKKAGDREIGGILMGEHVAMDEFHIVDITIQTSHGSRASFIRSLTSAIISLTKFFQRTQRNFTRFNYLGEWHSHPSFYPIPSMQDIESMFEIVTDQNVGAIFAILLILRLNDLNVLEGSATMFSPNLSYSKCSLLLPGKSQQ